MKTIHVRGIQVVLVEDIESMSHEALRRSAATVDHRIDRQVFPVMKGSGRC
jgi:hypothetical protein